MRHHRVSGFTLIEILVAVAIIALLAVLSLSAVTRATQAAQRAGCIINLHEINVAITAYTGEHGARPQIITEFWSYATASDRSWLGLLYDGGYISSLNTLRCPADTRTIAFTPDPDGIASYSALYVSDGDPTRRVPWSLPLDTITPPSRLLKIPHPDQMLIVVDGQNAVLSDGISYAHLIAGMTQDGMYWANSVCRHGHGTVQTRGSGPNGLFADGHAETDIFLPDLTEDNITLPVFPR